MAGSSSARIGIFGAGYVGLVTGACLAELGHSVVVRDVLPERIEALRAGEPPFFEPGLADLLAQNSERLSFTLDADEAAAEADFLFVCVGTPPTYSGDADLSAVWAVLDELPQRDSRAILVMKSTVPVGTGEKVRAALDARGARARRLRLEPRVPRRGKCGPRLPPARTGSSSARLSTATATPLPRCTSRSQRRSSEPTSPPRR